MSTEANPFPWHVLVVSGISALNNMAFGYDVGVISGENAGVPALRPPAARCARAAFTSSGY